MAAAAISEAWNDVRADGTPTHWLIVRASDNLKGLELAGTGPSGMGDFLEKFDGAETAMWGVMRIRAVDDRGTVKSVRAKFIRVNVLPDSMPVIKRAKCGPLKGQVDDLLSGTHATFDLSTGSSLTPAQVEKQLQATCGAHKPSYYDFDGADGADAAASAKPKGVAIPTSAPAPQSSEPSSPDAPPPPSGDDDAPPPATSGDIVASWKAVQSDSDGRNWLALTYDGKDIGTARVLAEGAGGLDELKEAFDEDLVIFAGLRVTAIDDRGSVKSVRAKYVFVQYIGPGVKPLTRAKAGPARSHFETVLHGTHLSVNITDERELTADGLQKKLHANCGAHQPNRYEFGAKITDCGDL